MVKKINETVYYVGVNDRRIHRFENFWPMPHGVSYNSYVIKDDKITLIDTVEVSKFDKFLSNIIEVIGDRDIDYLVVNHMEPDHSGSIANIVMKYPNIKIIGNATTMPMIEGYYKQHDNLITVNADTVLDLGYHKLVFAPIPMVHWPESMVTYDTTDKILFSNDAFGTFGTLDGGIFDDELDIEFYIDEMRRYYSNIVGKYGMPVQKALKALGGLEIKVIAPSHGPVWRSDISRVIGLYDKWSKCEAEAGVVIIFGSMYGYTEEAAEIIAEAVVEAGVKNVRIYDASKTHLSYLLSEIWKYKGVVIGSCAYNGSSFTPIKNLCSSLELYMPKNKYLGIFGGMSWCGGGVSTLQKFAENIKWEMVAPAVEIKYTTKDSDISKLKEIGTNIAGLVIKG